MLFDSEYVAMVRTLADEATRETVERTALRFLFLSRNGNNMTKIKQYKKSRGAHKGKATHIISASFLAFDFFSPLQILNFSHNTYPQ